MLIGDSTLFSQLISRQYWPQSDCCIPTTWIHAISLIFVCFPIREFCVFHTVHGILKARILKRFAISFPSGWKDPDAGKDWRREEKETTADEMVRWHHWLDGREFEQAPGVGDEQGSLVCCSPWGHKESDTTKWLTWIEQFLRGQLSVKCIHTFLQPISRIFPVM